MVFKLRQIYFPAVYSPLLSPSIVPHTQAHFFAWPTVRPAKTDPSTIHALQVFHCHESPCAPCLCLVRNQRSPSSQEKICSSLTWISNFSRRKFSISPRRGAG